METTVNIQNNIMILSTGTVTDTNSMLSNLYFLMDHPDYNQEFGLVIDLRESGLSKVPTEEIRSYIEGVRKIAHLMPTTVANVVSNDMEYGMLRMYLSISDDTIQADRNLFRNIEAAIEWVRDRKKEQT